ncbi:hypothetical protein HMPREF3225_00547 [Staphylococcus lugdunensis]|uniref:Uncharacterized protein n=1 Tax=Staphylococcus lugdunensis TaxID=28035 RepID=A0ABD4EHR4_STALU|nr:hypothetical protein HMPREF3225_00547 [Staphylococcus lugdunensis]
MIIYNNIYIVLALHIVIIYVLKLTEIDDKVISAIEHFIIL